MEGYTCSVEQSVMISLYQTMSRARARACVCVCVLELAGTLVQFLINNIVIPNWNMTASPVQLED
jgi:hypothetical protein